MQSVSKNNESAAIAQFAATAMRFQIGTTRKRATLYRYGSKRASVALSRTPRATTRTLAGLQEVAAAAQFAPMRFEHKDHADARYLQDRFIARASQVAYENEQPNATMPYAMVAYRLTLRARKPALHA